MRKPNFLQSFGQVQGRQAGEGSDLPLLPKPSLRRQASSVESQRTHSRGEEDSPRLLSRADKDSPRALSRAIEDSPRALSRADKGSPRTLSRGDTGSPKALAKDAENSLTKEEDKEAKLMEDKRLKVSTFF